MRSALYLPHVLLTAAVHSSLQSPSISLLHQQAQPAELEPAANPEHSVPVDGRGHTCPCSCPCSWPPPSCCPAVLMQRPCIHPKAALAFPGAILPPHLDNGGLHGGVPHRQSTRQNPRAPTVVHRRRPFVFRVRKRSLSRDNTHSRMKVSATHERGPASPRDRQQHKTTSLRPNRPVETLRSMALGPALPWHPPPGVARIRAADGIFGSASTAPADTGLECRTATFLAGLPRRPSSPAFLSSPSIACRLPRSSQARCSLLSDIA
ncbi:uncharacterized protein BJ171DRAFT_122430 [Polychytrium aggregatum]|uniref:uncharacterized protein n=1 Tax=Polychytrium aggregatum TaxID=110093 RepID=UPI0022FEBAF2|nr:uncharacterized protein BJ171DRAFT_122430 [Polychytrium aggregatum]KAI9204287.1 hypothetical protein BJ171DRAFT_122430 [Polychytrium aggregatum]